MKQNFSSGIFQVVVRLSENMKSITSSHKPHVANRALVGASLFRVPSYLWYTQLFAGIQEVLHISPTLGHAEFGLEAQEQLELYMYI